MIRRRHPDYALARRLRRGDQAAFDELFDSVFERLHRFAMSCLEGDEEAAQEVVQATLCKLVDRLHSYRGEAPMFHWLRTICRNEIHDHFRRRRRIVALAPVEESPAVRAALESLAATPEGAAERLERQQVVRLVHATLDHLPPRYAEALEMRYLEGLGVSEVARRLAVGYKAAESILSRARAAFRNGFQQVAAAAAGGPGRLGGTP